MKCFLFFQTLSGPESRFTLNFQAKVLEERSRGILGAVNVLGDGSAGTRVMKSVGIYVRPEFKTGVFPLLLPGADG